MAILRIATRKSALALEQANIVAKKLTEIYPSIQIKIIPMITSGDQLQKKTSQAMNKGLFVKELEEALLQNQADIAVHSMKDVPSQLPDGLILDVICTRNNPFDALITQKNLNLTTLPQKARIGTSSLRRQSQLLWQRSDLDIQLLRGNINTRLSQLKAGKYDAIVLAVAGLQRLGFEHYAHQIFTEKQMVPACGQGALGIECRYADTQVQDLIRALNDPLTALCVQTERKVNSLFGGGCNLPLGIYCKPYQKKQLYLQVRILTPDGKTIIEDERIGLESEAELLAEECIKKLTNQGAYELLPKS